MLRDSRICSIEYINALLSHNSLLGIDGTGNYHLSSGEHTELTGWLDDVTLSSDDGSITMGGVAATFGTSGLQFTRLFGGQSMIDADAVTDGLVNAIPTLIQETKWDNTTDQIVAVPDDEFLHILTGEVIGLTSTEALAVLSNQAGAAFSWNSQSLTNINVLTASQLVTVGATTADLIWADTDGSPNIRGRYTIATDLLEFFGSTARSAGKFQVKLDSLFYAAEAAGGANGLETFTVTGQAGGDGAFVDGGDGGTVGITAGDGGDGVFAGDAGGDGGDLNLAGGAAGTGNAAANGVVGGVNLTGPVTLGDGGTTNYTKISATGDIMPAGSAFLVFEKASGNGIKVDQTTPTFGFADLIGDQFSKNTGGTKPTLTTYNGAAQAWQFTNGDEAYMTYHIPHDYVLGTDIHLHIHWSQNAAGATGGTIDFKYFAIYAKGWNQASGSTFTSTPITATFTTINIDDGGSGLNRYQQHITEVTISAASATAALFDRDDFEPDGIIELTLEMDADNLTGTASSPFIHYADIHYQTTGLIGTKSRSPDFYA